VELAAEQEAMGAAALRDRELGAGERVTAALDRAARPEPEAPAGGAAARPDAEARAARQVEGVARAPVTAGQEARRDRLRHAAE